jgi:hypothetical protein
MFIKKSREVRWLALCEAYNVVLKPRELYRFYVVKGCKECERLAKASKV